MKKLLIVLIIIIILFGGIVAYNYFKPNIIELETLDDSVLQGKDINNPVDLKGIIEEVQQKNILPANPRIKVFYQGVEVAYIDHLGNIYGSTGWFTSVNATTMNSTVFYEVGERLALNLTLSLYTPNSTSDIQLLINDTGVYSTANSTYDAKVSFNQTNIAYYNNTNIFQKNQNMSTNNITDVGCIIFKSGGSWCSG